MKTKEKIRVARPCGDSEIEFSAAVDMDAVRRAAAKFANGNGPGQVRIGPVTVTLIRKQEVRAS